MGRYYNGDIEGKFWFGVQGSDDIQNLVTIDQYTYYSWKICNCTADIDADNYCKYCYESIKEHIDDVTENEEYDDECLYYEDYTTGYSLDESTHYAELKENMEKLRTEINDEIIESFDKIKQNDKILDAFTGVFDDTQKLIHKIEYEKEEKQAQLILLARYTLGYQIEYCLRTTGSCNVNCEN